MNLTTILLVAALVLLFAGFFAIVFWLESLKQKKINIQLKEVAKNLSGQCVDNGPWKHPLIVVDHERLRTRIGLERSKVNDSTGTSMLQVKQLKITTDGLDPQYKMSIVPLTLTAKASAWVKGRQARTGMESFDDTFVVESNRFQDSMREIISPDVARKLASVSRFDPLKILAGNAGKKKPKNADPIKNTPLERKRKSLPIWKINLDAMAKQINKHRFKLSINEGKSELLLLVQESEMSSLTEFIYTLIDTQREIVANLSTLERCAVNKPAINGATREA